MGPRPLKNFPKHQRVLRFTSSYYYGRWCIFRVVSRLAGFLFDDVQVWPSPAGYLAPLFAVRQRSRRIDLVLSRIKPRQLTSARLLRMKKRSGLHTVLPEDSSYVWEKKKKTTSNYYSEWNALTLTSAEDEEQWMQCFRVTCEITKCIKTENFSWTKRHISFVTSWKGKSFILKKMFC